MRKHNKCKPPENIDIGHLEDAEFGRDALVSDVVDRQIEQNTDEDGRPIARHPEPAYPVPAYPK